MLQIHSHRQSSDSAAGGVETDGSHGRSVCFLGRSVQIQRPGYFFPHCVVEKLGLVLSTPVRRQPRHLQSSVRPVRRHRDTQRTDAAMSALRRCNAVRTGRDEAVWLAIPMRFPSSWQHVSKGAPPAEGAWQTLPGEYLTHGEHMAGEQQRRRRLHLHDVSVDEPNESVAGGNASQDHAENRG